MNDIITPNDINYNTRVHLYNSVCKKWVMCNSTVDVDTNITTDVNKVTCMDCIDIITRDDLDHNIIDTDPVKISIDKYNLNIIGLPKSTHILAYTKD